MAVVDPADVPPIPGIPLVRRREDLATLGPLDFIDICTPTSSHVELALWGLEHGMHVVCEKPVALTREEAERIAVRARASGRVVMPCHQYRYNPAWLQVRRWLDDGAIGRWHLAEFSVYRPFADQGSQGGQPWRVQSGAGRGGVLLDHGTQLIYQIQDVAGPPHGVQAWTGRLLHQSYEVEDTASVLLTYPDRLARLFLTWAGRSRENHIRFIGPTGAIEWQGGELRLERDGRIERFDFSRELDKASYWRWFACLFQDFVAAMDAGTREHALQDIAQVAAVLEQAYATAPARS